MAKLVRLQISGIRNFGPSDCDAAKIKFSSPVTLFLGQNGCGKTTIIESLKYACTNDVPAGSSNGQGFIHDPKISGTRMTKGQVRLKVIDAKGTEITIYKSAQVTQEKDKTKFTSLDATISIKKPNGVAEQLSSRCLDIGKQFCDMLGVSKPILNYVIFCHQEDSLWPLDEGKALKEKFDKIFDIDNYNKCIEGMRTLARAKERKLKDLSCSVQDKKKVKNMVENDRAELETKKKKFEDLELDSLRITEQKQPIETRIREILKLEENISKFDKAIAEHKGQQKLLQEKQKSSLRIIGTEFTGSDFMLSEEISNFEERRKEEQVNLTNLVKKKSEIEKSKEDLQKLINRVQVKIGEMKQKKEMYEKNLLERKSLIEASAVDLKTNIVTSLDDETGSMAAIKALKDALRASKEEMEKQINKSNHAETDLQSEIDVLRERKIESKKGIDHKMEQIKGIKQKSASIRNQLHDLDVNDGELKTFKSKIDKIDKELKSLAISFNASEVQAIVNKENRNIAELEAQIEELESELKILRKNALTEHDIETNNQNVLKCEVEIKKLKNKHSDNFAFLFGETPSKNFKSSLDAKKDESYSKIKNITETISLEENEVTKLSTELKATKSNVKNLEGKLERNQHAINEVCKGKSFDTMTKELASQIEALQKDKGQYNSAKVMYEKFITHFQTEKPCCPICKTNFEEQQAINMIINTLRTQIKDIPQALQKVEQELAEKQLLYEKVLQLKPLNVQVQELSDAEIPLLQEDVETMSKNLEDKKKQLAELNEELKEPQKIFDICNSISQDCYILDQRILEESKSKEKIETLKGDLVIGASNKSRHEVESELELKKQALADSRTNHNNQQKRLLQNKEREQSLREDRSKIVDKQLEIEKVMQGKPQLEEQLESLKTEEVKLKEEIEQLKVVVDERTRALTEAEDNRRKVKASNAAANELLRKKLTANETKINNIMRIQNLITEYVGKGEAGQFDQALSNLVELKGKDQKLEETKSTVEGSINKQNDFIRNHEVEISKLRENIELRMLRKQEKDLMSEIEDLQKQRGNFDQIALHEERRKLESQHYKINNEANKLEGSKIELQNAVKDLEKKLNSPEYRTAYSDYRKKFFEMKLTQKQAVDIKISAAALEASVLEFHSERMQQINRIIREYWRQIYRGNDIDYIEIKTELPTGTANKRVYNYRVVQMKNGIELDMRGRCSAGQKVLACLIIRMALAETFSSNCGILALDEPTTNLDRDNINSLSEALARIITTRQIEKNFQLLVITHDEDFLNTLMQMDQLPFYYKVQRNDIGNSIITKERV